MRPTTPGAPPNIADGRERDVGEDSESAMAPVIRLLPRANHRPQRSHTQAAAAVLIAVALALSPLWSGYYNFGLWAPLALAAVMVLMIVALGDRPAFTHQGLTAGGAVAVLLALSATSMLWAQSRDSAWTDSNRLALYVVIFAIGLLAIRERRSARTVALILGVPALLASVVIVVKLIVGDGQGAFFQGRLDAPLGYINGTAGLLVMGMWPWLALSEAASRRTRAGALAAAAVISSTAVMTQSRAIVPAMLVATVLVLLAAPRRTQRGVHLIVIAAAVAAGLHWTLAVYSSSGPTQTLPLASGVLRNAGLAVLAGGLLAGIAELVFSALADRLGSGVRARAGRRLGQALLLGTLAAVVGVAIAGHSTIQNQYDAFVQNKVDQAAPNRFLSAGGFRYDLWRMAFDEFKSSPLGGLGAGNYDAQYYLLRRNPQSVVVPHSLELQMAAELGIGGVLALLAFCGAVLWGAFARRRTLASGDPLIKIAAVGMFAAWLVATSVDWLYDFPGPTEGAMLAAALLVVPQRVAVAGGGRDAHGDGARRPRGRSRRDQAVLVVGLAVLALIAASVGRQYVASRYRAAGSAKVQSSPVAAIRTLQIAEQLDPYSLQTLYDLASAYAALNDYTDARTTLAAAQRLEPENYVPPALLGDLAMRRGYYGAALTDYTRALRLDPRDPAVQGAVQRARAHLTASAR